MKNVCLRLLRIKPDVGKKQSENSLLKSISFDEPFLGEELVQEGKIYLVHTTDFLSCINILFSQCMK